MPVAWGTARAQSPEPWPNGLRIASGGWGHATPWMGPLDGTEPLAPGRFFTLRSQRQHKRAHRPNTFFYMRATFAFPEVTRAGWWSGQRHGAPFGVDRLTLTYRAPADVVEQPYAALLAGTTPDAGVDAGNGWREVRRSHDTRTVFIRFDSRDWRMRGGVLPRRLAASYSPHLWSHYRPFR